MVEFFGIPRQRAGVAQVELEANTVAELLEAILQAFPDLEDIRSGDGHLAPQYLLSVEGRRFVADPATPLMPGENVLLLSADVGG